MAPEAASAKILYLDELPFGEILDPFGPPERRLSYCGTPLEIAGVIYERGLGVHAPSRLEIRLDGRAVAFDATVGVDPANRNPEPPGEEKNPKEIARYFYGYDHKPDVAEGKGTVLFEVYADAERLFASERLSAKSPPVRISVCLEGAQSLVLLTDPTEDGCFADYANWCEAQLKLRDGEGSGFVITHHATDILVNHAGFKPGNPKTCYRHGTGPAPFNVIDAKTRDTVFSGEMSPLGGSLGDYLRGDFSVLSAPGRYYVESGNRRSIEFEIREETIDTCLRKHLAYIRLQRSGHPTEGWRPGQHLDDGKRQDTGEHQDVTGGWYDASDVRKPAKGNALLLFALSRLLETGVGGVTEEALLDEIKWGNKFLFSMQEPEGYLMHYIGSTWEGFKENVWTDNRIGTDDDRTIITRPTDINTHLAFVAANATIAGQLADMDPGYSAQCLEQARRGWDWIRRQGSLADHEDIGLAITAATALYQATRNPAFAAQAKEHVEQLLARQIMDEDVIRGYFFDWDSGGPREHGLAIMGLVDFAEAFPEDPATGGVRAAVQSTADGYYAVLADTNAFSIIPWIVSRNPLGGDKKIGPYWYKNFLHVGVNQHLGRNGAGLAAAARLLDQPEYLRLAQRHLDWIYGANPFNASTVHGIGHNHPTFFRARQKGFDPCTPELTGGVMTGFGSNHPHGDALATFPGWWWTTEYWSPSVCYTIVLAAMLR